MYLTLSAPDSTLGSEGYVLTVDRRVTLSAPEAQGVFWATRTLLQMLCRQPDGLPKGEARDYPRFSHRGFMLDVGRKFFTMEYLRQCVKVLSFYKMNELQVHLNDNGFPQFYGNAGTAPMPPSACKVTAFPG